MWRAWAITTGVLLVLATAALLLVPNRSPRGQRQPPQTRELPPTRWRPVRVRTPRHELTRLEAEQLAQLISLPYLAGSVEARTVERVTVYDREAACGGLNLWNSGHAPEAFVMDMDGNVLHRWRFAIDDIWPDRRGRPQSGFWRRVHWSRNGDVLAIFGGVGLLKLDRDSNLLWSYRGGCHHQACVTDDGQIYVLSMKSRVIPHINPDQPVIDELIAVLDPDGELLEQCSLLDCFENSDYQSLLAGMRTAGEIFHTNTIAVLDGSLDHLSPVFRKGHVLISVLYLDTIAIVDLERRCVVWALAGNQTGMWSRQHDPRLLPNGHMLVFDNLGRDGKSKVIEFEPFTGRITWKYPADTNDALFSATCGTSARLSNGNTLITESDNGRALEVTPEGRIVWEFHNPHRAGENNELVATLFETVRVDEDFFPWLDTNRAD
jgi:hypothetical protein